MTVQEMMEFLSQFDDSRKLDLEFFELLKAELNRINVMKRVRKHRRKK